MEKLQQYHYSRKQPMTLKSTSLEWLEYNLNKVVYVYIYIHLGNQRIFISFKYMLAIYTLHVHATVIMKATSLHISC